MRTVCYLLLSFVSAYACALDQAETRHLLWRAGLGPSMADLETYADLDRAAAVDRLLAGDPTALAVPPPGWTEEDLPTLMKAYRAARMERKKLPDKERRELNKVDQKRQNLQGRELKAWWVEEMIATPDPLAERMVMFWHNIFTTELRKIKSAHLQWNQHQKIRHEAMGSYAVLLRSMVNDISMQRYLDGIDNKVGKPNENLGRELLELFSLGEGHYTEEDVIEASRALTGYIIDLKNGELRVLPKRHDNGTKTILGVSKNFDAESLVDHILAQRRCADYISERLWRHFIATPMDQQTAESLANGLMTSGYDIKPALKAILTHEAFWADENRGSMVKNPLELVVGCMRIVNAHEPNGQYLGKVAVNLGQNPFDPPGVEGWPDGVDGSDWLTSDGLLDRLELMQGYAQALDQFSSPNKKNRKRKGRQPMQGADKVPASDLMILTGVDLPGSPSRRDIFLAAGFQRK